MTDASTNEELARKCEGLARNLDDLVTEYGGRAGIRAKLKEISRALAEPAPPAEPDLGTWWVDATAPECWYGPATWQDSTGIGGKNCHYDSSWQIFRCWIDDGHFLRIPPQPALPDGEEFLGEVRLPLKGERYVTLNGQAGVAQEDWVPLGSPDGGRRWILKAKVQEPGFVIGVDLASDKDKSVERPVDTEIAFTVAELDAGMGVKGTRHARPEPPTAMPSSGPSTPAA